jgi:protein SCO1/2
MRRLAVSLLVALLANIGIARADEVQIALDHPFALVDADGDTVTSNDFPGKFLLVYFGYTHCADECPTALSTIVEALDELGPAAEHVQPLFITVDPERDHGPMLRAFTAAFDRRIVGLTGTPQQIEAAARPLGIQYQKVLDGNENYVIDHSTTISVIPPDRKAATTFAMAEPYQIAAKMFALLQQAGVALGDVNNLGAYR